MSDDTQWLALASMPISRRKKRLLLQRYGSVGSLFAEAQAVAELKSLLISKSFSFISIDKVLADANAQLEAIRVSGWNLVPAQSGLLPASLLNIPDPPLMLFVCGQLSPEPQPGIAIIGSRKATPLGERLAERFASTLSGWGLTVVSGLALGIDSAAHRGAIQRISPTYAVLANGPDTIYPRTNQRLAQMIVESGGALITENPPGTPLRPHLFPERNRLISGLSMATLVVEAGLKSGSLVTAHLALEQGREVFAVPGALTNPQARGCHQLIKQGAVLVESPEDIINALHQPLRSLCSPVCLQADEPDRVEHPVLKLLSAEGLTQNQLIEVSGMGVNELQTELARLELSGEVLKRAGRYFRCR